jgi:hypothetical protein
MSSIHAQYHFSITCHTDDKAVMFCLRSLAHFAEHSSQKNIAWSGTTDDAWERSGHHITLRFTNTHYRNVFRQKANELLGDRWREARSSDNDPATPKER